MDPQGEELSSPVDANDYPNCFGCGAENQFGLRLALKVADSTVSAEFTPDRHHEGWPGIVHGGVVSALLYEVMENWPYLNGSVTMMRSMDIRLLKPASIGQRITAVSWMDRRDGRNMWVDGKLECRDAIIARGRASLVVLTDAQRKRLGI